MGLWRQTRTALTTIATAALLGLYIGAAVRLEGQTPLLGTRPQTVLPKATLAALASSALSSLGNGQASLYADALAGLPTASGQPYDPEARTAAHRTLPLGSQVQVTSLATGLSTVVRINDRGPFVGKRSIDLSRAAARDLGMLPAGSAKVELRLLTP